MTFYHFRGHILNIKSVYENLKIMLRGHISEKNKVSILNLQTKKLHFSFPFHSFFLFLPSDWLRPVREIKKRYACLVSREPEKFVDFISQEA